MNGSVDCVTEKNGFQFSTAPLITSTGVWWARLAGRMDRRDEADGHVRQKSAELSAANFQLLT